jgi:hypothetical protein
MHQGTHRPAGALEVPSGYALSDRCAATELDGATGSQTRWLQGQRGPAIKPHPAQAMRNRCTAASGLCRSRRTVDAKVKCSSTAQLRFPDALRDPLTPHQSFPSSALTPCSTPPSTWTSAHDHPRKHLHQHYLTSLTPHTSAFRCPIALSSYPPTPTHDSGAPMVPVVSGVLWSDERAASALVRYRPLSRSIRDRAAPFRVDRGDGLLGAPLRR